MPLATISEVQPARGGGGGIPRREKLRGADHGFRQVAPNGQYGFRAGPAPRRTVAKMQIRHHGVKLAAIGPIVDRTRARNNVETCYWAKAPSRNGGGKARPDACRQSFRPTSALADRNRSLPRPSRSCETVPCRPLKIRAASSIGYAPSRSLDKLSTCLVRTGRFREAGTRASHATRRTSDSGRTSPSRASVFSRRPAD